MMTTTLVCSGHEILIDTEDYEKVSQYVWRVNGGGYAVSRRKIIMHRLILGLNDPFMYVDHINRNKLDNRKENLRVVSQSINKLNASKQKCNCSSKYKGVFFSKDENNWRSAITFMGKRIYLYRSVVEEDCAYAYCYAFKLLLNQEEPLEKSIDMSLVLDPSKIERLVKYQLKHRKILTNILGVNII